MSRIPFIAAAAPAQPAHDPSLVKRTRLPDSIALTRVRGSAGNPPSPADDLEALIGMPAAFRERPERSRNPFVRCARLGERDDLLPLAATEALDRYVGAGGRPVNAFAVIAACCSVRTFQDLLLVIEAAVNGAAGADPGILPHSLGVIAGNSVMGAVAAPGLFALGKGMREQARVIDCRKAAALIAGFIARHETGSQAFDARAHRDYHETRLFQERMLNWFSLRNNFAVLSAMVVGQVMQPAMPAALFGLSANDLARAGATTWESADMSDRMRGRPTERGLIDRDIAFTKRLLTPNFSMPGRVDRHRSAEIIQAATERLRAMAGPMPDYRARRQRLQRVSALGFFFQFLGTAGMGFVNLGMTGRIRVDPRALLEIGAVSAACMATGLYLVARSKALTSNDCQPPPMKRQVGAILGGLDLAREDGERLVERHGDQEFVVVAGVASRLDTERDTIRKMLAARENTDVAAECRKEIDARIDAGWRWGSHVPRRVAVELYDALTMGLDPRAPGWRKGITKSFVQRGILRAGGAEAIISDLLEPSIGRMAGINRTYAVLDKRDIQAGIIAADLEQGAEERGTGEQRSLRRLCRVLLEAPIVMGETLKLWAKDLPASIQGRTGRLTRQLLDLRNAGSCCPADLEARRILDHLVARYCDDDRADPEKVRFLLDALTEATARYVAFAAPNRHATEISDSAELLHTFMRRRDAEGHYETGDAAVIFADAAIAAPMEEPEETYVVAIEGMTCGSCTSTVKSKLSGLDWISEANGRVAVDLAGKTATVRMRRSGAAGDTAARMLALIEAVEETGFDASAAPMPSGRDMTPVPIR